MAGDSYGLDHLTSDATSYFGAFTGQTLPILLGEEEWSVAEGVTTLTRRWVVAMSRVNSGSGVPNYAGVFPAVGQPCVGQHYWMTVKSYRVRQNQRNGKLAVVEQVCEKAEATPEPPLAEDGQDPDGPPLLPSDPDYNLDSSQLPWPEVIFEGSTGLVNIKRHPLFLVPNPAWGNKSMAEFWDPEAGEFADWKLDPSFAGNDQVLKDLAGLTHFINAGLTVRTREYQFNEPETGEFYNKLGKFSIPDDAGYSGDEENWMVISGTKEKINGFWVLELVYLYQETPWPSWLEAGGSF